MRTMKQRLWKLAGAGLAIVCLLVVTEQRTHAQDLTTLLAYFLRQLYAGRVVIPTTADSSAYAVLDIATTWNNGANTPTAIKLNVLDSASNASSLLMDLQVNSASKFNVTKAGSMTLAGGIGTTGSIAVAASASYGFSARGYIQAPADGVFELTNAAVTDFTRLQFGGTTASFPALSRNGTDLSVVDANGGTATSSFLIPFIKSTTGVRYVCVDTNGKLISQAAACSGT
jgi:hypothetical protein